MQIRLSPAQSINFFNSSLCAHSFLLHVITWKTRSQMTITRIRGQNFGHQQVALLLGAFLISIPYLRTSRSSMYKRLPSQYFAGIQSCNIKRDSCLCRAFRNVVTDAVNAEIHTINWHLGMLEYFRFLLISGAFYVN